MIERIAHRLRRLNAVYHPQHIYLPPRWLVLGVNNTCNLHCKMCDVGVTYTQSNFFQNLMGSKPVHMPIELFKKIADQASLHFPHVKLGYAFTEPLIYTHLEESLEYAQTKNLFTSLTTNGLGLKKWCVTLDRLGLRELNLSLDGPEDVHNFIRGNKHSYSMAMDGVNTLLSSGSKIRIGIFCVITEWNTGKLVEFLEGLPRGLHKVGLMHSNFTPEHIAASHNAHFGGLYPATASNVTETKLDSLDVDTLYAQIAEIKKREWGFQVQFFPDLDSPEQFRQYYQDPTIFIGRRCIDIFSNMMIKSNGDVIPAHGRCYNLTIGNLHNQDLKQIWNSTTVSNFRREVSRAGGFLPACARCCSAFVR